MIDFNTGLKHLTTKKTDYSDIEPLDMHSFPFYMVNRILSMDPDSLTIINSLQIISNKYLDNEQTYRVLSHVLPTKTKYNKLLKATTNKNSIDTVVIKCIMDYYNCNNSTAIDYYNLLMQLDTKMKELSEILLSSDLDVNEYKKLIKKMEKLWIG